MYIRSQDRKKLVDMSNTSIEVESCMIILQSTIGERDNLRWFKIGEYSSKEKAVKVLDMIQERYYNASGSIFNPQTGAEYAYTRNEVFLMPQDSEVANAEPEIPVQCVNGSCPIALSDEYEERGMDVVHNCNECQYNTVSEKAGITMCDVKCSNCIYHVSEQDPCHGRTAHYCKKLKIEVKSDFYCAYGKVKQVINDRTV